MANINAFFETFFDEELYSKIHGRSNVIRIYVMVKFKKQSGFTDPYPAIIDTGAHTSVIPAGLWEKSEHKILGEHYIKGLVPNAKLNVKVGEIKAVFIDMLNISKEYSFLSFFSLNDQTPLILGFKELLSKFKVTIDYTDNFARLEEK